MTEQINDHLSRSLSQINDHCQVVGFDIGCHEAIITF